MSYKKQPSDSDDSALQIREAVYARLFGDDLTVSHELGVTGFEANIDVYQYSPGVDALGNEREFFTLVTSGLSNHRMPVPVESEPVRAELVIYAEEIDVEYIDLLRWLAKLPFEQADLWYGPGTTMTNGNPPRPIFAESSLDCFLFLMPPLSTDFAAHEELIIAGDPCPLLWVVPISLSERNLIRTENLDAFLELMDAYEHSFLFDHNRQPYC